MESPKYWAFISYSHKDNQSPLKWADWLHDSIEHFQVPPELVGRPGRGGDPIPARLYPVFQDRKELASSADLGESIRAALADSRHLIVICSPSAAASRYVNEEVEEFKRLERGSRILALIVEGEPPACFPGSLREPEPIAADARGAGENPQQRDDARLRVIAGLLGVGFDDLAQRDRARQLREERARTRRLRKLVLGFAALAAIAVVAGLLALFARAESQRNLIEARRRLAQIYVERAEAAYAARDLSQQALLLAEARVQDPDSVPASIVADLARRTGGAGWVVNATAGYDDIQAFAISPDERIAMVLTNAGRLIEIDAASGERLRETSLGVDQASALAIAPVDGSIAVAHFEKDQSGNLAGLISIFERQDLRRIRTLSRHTRRIVSLRFASDGRSLLSASDDRTAIVWDVGGGHVIRRLAGHAGDVNSVTAGGDGRLLATGSSDSTVALWSAATGKRLASFKAHDADVATAQLTAGDRWLVTSGGDATIRLWSVPEMKNIRELRGHDGSITVTSVSADGATLLSAGSDQTVRIWNLRNGELRQRLTGHSAWVVGAHLFRDSRSAISADRYGRVIRWTLPENADATDLIGGAATVRRGAFSPDGRLAATAGDDGLIRVWTVPDGSLAATLRGHDATVTGIAFLDAGRTLLSASHDETLRVWDIASRSETARLGRHSSLIWGLAIDRARFRALSAGANNELQLWDLGANRSAAPLHAHAATVNSAAFDPDGRHAASGANDRYAVIWDLETRRQVKSLEHRGQVASVAFAPDGRLATAAWGDPIRLWSAGDWQESTRLSCGVAGCDALAFSPDGGLLLGGGLDGALRVWDTASGRELRRIPAHSGRIYSVSVSPDGQFVLSTGPDGAARLWRLNMNDSAAPVEADEALLRRIRARTRLELRDGRIVLR